MSVGKTEEVEKYDTTINEKQNESETTKNSLQNNKSYNNSLEKKQNLHPLIEKSNIIQSQESLNINNSLFNINTTFSSLNPKYNISDNNPIFHNKTQRSFSSFNIFNENKHKNTNLRNFYQTNFQCKKTPKLTNYNIDYRFERVNNDKYYYPQNNKINFISFNKPGSSLYLQLKRSNENNNLIYMDENNNYNFYNRYKESNESNNYNYYFDYSNRENNNIIERIQNKNFTQTYHPYCNNTNINYSYYNSSSTIKEKERELNNNLFIYKPKPYQSFLKVADKFKENEKIYKHNY